MMRKNGGRNKFILDLELLNTHNSKGCMACGQKFSLGETVVLACGPWDEGPQLIHENEAVFDKKSLTYVERGCYVSGKF